MPMTGANIASLADIKQSAVQTGQLATETASQNKAATARAKGEVDDVVTTLRQQFTSTLDDLGKVADDADRQAGSSQWEGAARQQAVEAAADFRTGIAKLRTESARSLESFSKALDQQVTDLNDDISGKFTTLMHDAFEAFTAYGNAVSSYSENLQAVDNSVSRG